jgi:hypothetical protein
VRLLCFFFSLLSCKKQSLPQRSTFWQIGDSCCTRREVGKLERCNGCMGKKKTENQTCQQEELKFRASFFGRGNKICSLKEKGKVKKSILIFL